MSLLVDALRGARQISYKIDCLFPRFFWIVVVKVWCFNTHHRTIEAQLTSVYPS